MEKSIVQAAAILAAISLLASCGSIDEASGIARSDGIVDNETRMKAGFRPVVPGYHEFNLPTVNIRVGEDEEKIPNGILIRGCEDEPEEIALPLNAEDKNHFCDTVQATAYYAGEEGVYDVSAEYSWSIADPNVAMMIPLSGRETEGVQKPLAMTDLFWTNGQSQEPETYLTVCARPHDMPKNQTAPLCRNVVLRNVVNLEGAWCFAGPTFSTGAENGCQTLEIFQDGRYLDIGTNGKGSVYSKDVHFYRGTGYYFEAELENRDNMFGTVYAAGFTEVLGDFSAWRLPLP